MPALTKRIISAVCAVLLFFFIHKYFGPHGLFISGILVAIVAVYEFNGISFAPAKVPTPLRIWFFLACSLLLALSLMTSENHILYWGLILSFFFAGSLWFSRGRLDNRSILSFFSYSSLGFVYCVLFPSLTIKLISLESGTSWFVCLLAVVFAGDIFAYFGGITFGKKKLMEAVSPKKTIAGAVSGTLGSVAVGLVAGLFFFKAQPLWFMPTLAFLGSILAQSGDLFISLMKRVANKKDSGQIMPGHGGVLDRLDGVFFAAPVFYGAALLSSL